MALPRENVLRCPYQANIGSVAALLRPRPDAEGLNRRNFALVDKCPSLNHDNIICLPGQSGDMFSPVPSLAEGGDYYEYI